MVLMVACLEQKPEDSPKATQSDHAFPWDQNDLLQSWSHSREEEDPQTEGRIYRPTESWRFPPSRFRMRYEFKGDGTCRWMHLHPADRHAMRSCTWSFDPEEKDLVIVFDQKGNRVESFLILELKKDILRIVPVRKSQ
jgi:hypothetical protein